MSLSLILPASAVEPRSRCHLCDTEFPAKHRGRFERHVRECSRRNLDRLEAEQHRQESSLFLAGRVDPEYAAHVKAGGR